MMKFLRSKKGFTLVELMIVVAIIGILAGIAIPRYMNFVRRSREGATKGNLGAIRSALNIYYSDMDGFFPARNGLAAAPFLGLTANNYLDAIPAATEDCTNYAAHRPNGTTVDVTATNLSLSGSNNGGWEYLTPTAISTSVCRLVVNCTNVDTRFTQISSW